MAVGLAKSDTGVLSPPLSPPLSPSPPPSPPNPPPPTSPRPSAKPLSRVLEGRGGNLLPLGLVKSFRNTSFGFFNAAISASRAACACAAAAVAAAPLTSPEDWAKFPQMFRQAVSDAAVFEKVLAKLAAWHEAQIAAVQADLKSQTARADELMVAGQKAVESFKALLKAQQQSTKELVDLEVKQAERRAQLAAQQHLVQERVDRGEKLDSIREEINALAMANEVRTKQQMAGKTSHLVGTAAALAAAAAEAGSNPAAAATPLLQAAIQLNNGNDPLLAAVAAALPKQAVLTRAQIEHQFRGIKSEVAALSYFPGTHSGIVAHWFARLAVWLKMDERKAVQALSKEEAVGGVDAALARAELLLADGKLTAAAEELTQAVKDTAAAALLVEWVSEARKRASLEAAIAALQGHAASLAAVAIAL
uniref:MICOS complex subunit MIC60 n=1 Tax=Polytomella parva TaxID=51329 RepID=A0A6U0VF67_9CHLO|mmetsp:Transcript_24567/g.44148  ORF Transcript_24567/g.44148 Transcript_24567/m.44148 type:complete len:421 (+) Transcript_24567:479-1741(+)